MNLKGSLAVGSENPSEPVGASVGAFTAKIAHTSARVMEFALTVQASLTRGTSRASPRRPETRDRSQV